MEAAEAGSSKFGSDLSNLKHATNNGCILCFLLLRSVTRSDPRGFCLARILYLFTFKKEKKNSTTTNNGFTPFFVRTYLGPRPLPRRRQRLMTPRRCPSTLGCPTVYTAARVTEFHCVGLFRVLPCPSLEVKAAFSAIYAEKFRKYPSPLLENASIW